MSYWIIYYISIFSPLLPLAVGLRKRNTLLWYYAMVGCSFDIASLLIRTYSKHNGITADLAIAENVFLILEFVLISAYYRNKVFKNKKLFPVVTGILILLYILSNIPGNTLRLNLIGGAIFDFSCIVYAIIGFHSLLNTREVIFLDKSSFFWVNVAFLIYCTGNFLVFLFAGYLHTKDASFLASLWIFHNILNILFSILIAISFMKRNVE